MDSTSHATLPAAAAPTPTAVTLALPAPVTLVPAPASPLGTASSVGPGAPNRPADVRLVQERLRELGFPVLVDGRLGPQTARAIRMFASIVEGAQTLAEASERISPRGMLAMRLARADAPRWVAIPQGGPGWERIDDDGYGWGTERALSVIERAGARYQAGYLSAVAGAEPIMINDVSRKDGSSLLRGGRPEHVTHQNGLDVDIRLPRPPGSASPKRGSRVGWANYDREATYRIIEAFAADERVERVLFADRVLLERARAENKSWAHKLVFDGDHADHMHVDVQAPEEV